MQELKNTRASILQQESLNLLVRDGHNRRRTSFVEYVSTTYTRNEFVGDIFMDTGQKTESLARLVEDIERGSVVLPEFQRDFVWDVDKTYDLFDSFIKDIFVGSLDSAGSDQRSL